MAKKRADDESQTDTQDEAELESQEQVDETGLIKMHKDGQELHVHPTTVKDHKTAGWKLA